MAAVADSLEGVYGSIWMDGAGQDRYQILLLFLHIDIFNIDV